MIDSEMDLKALAAELHNSAILDRPKNEDVETQYCFWKFRHLTSPAVTTTHNVAGGDSVGIGKRVDVLEKENIDMRQEIKELRHLVDKLQLSVESLSKGVPGNIAICPAKEPKVAVCPQRKPSEKSQEADDEIDLFGSDEDDEETEEKAKVREARLKAYEEKKSKKPGPIAKSSVILDVKPWDDETDMLAMEALVRGIVKDGLVWGASKFVPVGYGIKKLQIMCVVEDDKISIEELQEQIQEFEDFVQSVDIAAFNKI